MREPSPSLLLDTASERLVVAVADGLDLLASRVVEARAQALLEVVDATLVEAGISPGQLADIGVGIGPGGFTGLRVGLATTRGMALALGIDLAPLATLQAIAWPALVESADPVWGVLDAKRGEVFAQRFVRVSGIAGFSTIEDSPLHVIPAADLDELVGTEPVIHDLVSPDGLAEQMLLAARRPPMEVLPAYGREPDAVPRQMVGGGAQ